MNRTRRLHVTEMTLTAADTEYEVQLPEQWADLLIRSQTAADAWRWCTKTGVIQAVDTGMPVRANESLSGMSGGPVGAKQTLYVASSVAGAILKIAYSYPQTR